MERAKLERSVARRFFTVAATALKKYLDEENLTLASAEFEKLSLRYKRLQEADNNVLALWLDAEDRDEQAMESDLDTNEQYDTKWHVLHQEFQDMKASFQSEKSHRLSRKSYKSIENSSNCGGKRHVRLPKLELPKFDGTICKWLAFWAQFKKIHLDSNLDTEDKFQYLRQCMEHGSTAKELVESFPPTSENYDKAIDLLKERFGKDELIIEHYVRELLQLVLAQSKGTNKTSNVRALYDKLMTQILALESLGVTQDKYAAFLYPLVESAIPEDILRAWNRSHLRTGGRESPLSALLEFVKHEVESDERIRLSRHGYEAQNNVEFSAPTASCFTAATPPAKTKGKEEKAPRACVWCDKTLHASSECNVAVNKTLQERKDFLKQKKACETCLIPGHPSKRCRKSPKCVICTKRHYAILCDKIPTTVLNQTETHNQTVLLPTLKINVMNGDNVVTVRVLLDSGAQRSFVRSDIAKQLKLEPVGKIELGHVLFGGQVTKKRTHNLHKFQVRSLDGSCQMEIQALEQEIICGVIPKLRQGSNSEQLKALGIVLSDCSDELCEIGILIGSDVLGSIFTGRSVQLEGCLVAIETKLGWSVQGPAIGAYSTLGNVQNHVVINHISIENFWDLEALGIKDQSESKNQNKIDVEIADYFKKTTTVNNEGRYEVRLPWKDTAKLLRPNYNLALKRLTSTTSKLVKLGIIDDYSKVFQEWQEIKIIEEVVDDDPNKGHYMPHHAVVRESSLTTRIRPVFDASAKDYNKLSLNSCLERGINLIELIPRLLIQFRRNAIGVTADIIKAFLQISVHPDDRDYLKFLWWQNVNADEKILKVFKHRRVVFGVTTSPYLLSATILHHLENFNSDTANRLKTAFYVDNCVLSVKNEDEMRSFMSEAKEIMMQGNFELRCWITGPNLVDEEVINTSVLGLMWDPQNDEIFCKKPNINLKPGDKITKRKVLSLAQSVFDPSGIACPITIIPRLVLQKCWIINIDWDEELPNALSKTIEEWNRSIDCLESCRMPRRVSINDLDQSNNSLHIFCDASQSAYATCIFMRSEYNGVVDVRLITAKSRVAPTKTVTVPRLELLAAMIGTRLATATKQGLALTGCKDYYWTDSSIVLAVIKRSNGLNVFVHNRVKEILECSSVEDWHHIPGELNPADLPSRGCNPEALARVRWWEGPSWLKDPESEWPHSEPLPDESEVQKEMKKSCLLAASDCKFSEQLTYFSKYTKIIRMVGWMLRFTSNCRTPKKLRESKDLSAQEYVDAERRVLKILQTESFSQDKELDRRFNLETFVDNQGVIRVKTRLTLGNDNYDFISPILLAGNNCIIERLVRQAHVQNLHVGSQTLISKLRENYWIINIRRLAKKIVRQCVRCRRHSAKPCTVPSAPLPTDRITCGSVFEVTGIDLAGPLYLKSGAKCWIVLFTCATYRAVHLEICTSLSTEDFLLALRRFLARRGNIVRVIYSDNATNFHGSDNLLRTINWREIATDSSVKKISWRFIPPSAPWWGGFWERLIKIMKNILRRVLGKSSLHLTEMITVICEVEAMMNARPLTYIAMSTENLVPLSPSMFLNTDAINADSNADVLIDNLDGKILSSRWRYLTQLKTDLKQRFRSEYLGLLAQGTINNQIRAVKVGDVVLIGADNQKRLNWPLGVVEQIMAGADGNNRVARLKTQGGYLVRPLQRLYPLEVPREWSAAAAVDP